MEDLSTLQKIAVYILPVILAITVHEAAHALTARYCGDNTAYAYGRVSLNPIKHIDIFGTILFPLIGIILGGFIFGWAKPVPVNYSNLYNPKRDIFLVAGAGPLSNLLMAILWAIVLKLAYIMHIYGAYNLPDGVNSVFNLSILSQDINLSSAINYFTVPLILMAKFGVMINIVIMIINLLPILPLDGGRMLLTLLPYRFGVKFAALEKYGLFIVIGLMLFGVFDLLITPAVNYVNYILFKML